MSVYERSNKQVYKKTYTFDDVSIIPKYSDLESREDVSLSVNLSGLWLDIPVVSAPMDTVTDASMAVFMAQYGGMGIIHRYMDIETQLSEFKWAYDQIGEFNTEGAVGAAVGINGDGWERTQALVEAGCRVICLDVAHGNTNAAMTRIEEIASQYPEVVIISANVATFDAAKAAADHGADIIRVGVGAGSACTTRVVAGCGVPQITAIHDCWDGLASSNTPKEVGLLSDGGIRNSGDAVKALAAGADAVMMGGFFAPFPVSAGPTVYQDLDEKTNWSRIIDTFVVDKNKGAEQVFSEGFPPIVENRRIKKKLYRGMASDSALSQFKGDDKYIVEGDSFLIDIDYDFEKTMVSFIDGLRLGLSYVGALNVSALHVRAEFVEVTHAGQIEATSHGKGVN